MAMLRGMKLNATVRRYGIYEKLSLVLLVGGYVFLFKWSLMVDKTQYVISDEEMSQAEALIKKESPAVTAPSLAEKELDKLYADIPDDTEYEEVIMEKVYTHPYNKSVKGKAFHVSTTMLRHLGIPPKRYVTLNDGVMDTFVFATASDFKFFPYIEEAVATIQEFKPLHKTVVYDLGLRPGQVMKVKSWCNVVYKRFDFSKYPEHVRDLTTYAWKPLIILDVLKEYPGVLWMDSSVRLITNNFTVLLDNVKNTGGGISLTTTGHSTYAATYPTMYEYLPSDLAALQREEQREATLMFYRTKEMYAYILPWLAFCALHKRCLAPDFAQRACFFDGDNFRKWGQCHRYDQSAVNLLFLNYFHYNSWNYYAESRVVKVQRFVTNQEKVKVC